MNFRCGLVLLLTAVWLVGEAAGKDAAVFREVRVQLLGMDGKPAVGREVSLIGLTRGSMGQIEETDDAPREGWHFKTDGEGRFVVWFGEFRMGDEPVPLPGWGNYGLVAEPDEKDAGALSSYIVHQSEPWADARRDWGKTVTTGKEPLNLTMRIQKGVTLRGRIVDYLHPEKGGAGVEVSVCVDLRADTRTGFGGEVLEQSATTDATGWFAISHIYPAPFRIGLPSEETIWLKTRPGGGKWVDDAVDIVAPVKGTSEYQIGIRIADRRLFRYRGKVVDRSGKPLARATVTFGVSFHRVSSTWGDSHHFEKTMTMEDGTYEILLSTPWVRGMCVEKPGFVRKDRWDEAEGAPFAPGVYNFTLQGGEEMPEVGKWRRSVSIPFDSPGPEGAREITPRSSRYSVVGLFRSRISATPLGW